MTAGPQLVSIFIATRNRKQELAVAIESCLAQTYQPLDILVLDDASDDGTADMVRADYPEVRVLRNETNLGIAAARNRGLREAKGEILFSLDDDCYYTDPRTIELALAAFDAAPRAAVLALAFVEPNRTAETAATAGAAAPRLRTFGSGASAVRRSMVLEAGGYRDFFFYRGEERDLSIRLAALGREIVPAATPAIVHLFSARRDWSKMFPLGIRNNLLFDWLNIPPPYVLPRLLADAVQLFLYKLTPSQILPRLWHVLAGFGSCVRCFALRRPVPRSAYRLFRSLPCHGPLPWAGGPIPPPCRRPGGCAR